MCGSARSTIRSAAKPVTHEKDRPIGGYFWAYTNKHILYSQDDKGDENFHVYAVNLDTGETKDITPLDENRRPQRTNRLPKKKTSRPATKARKCVPKSTASVGARRMKS